MNLSDLYAQHHVYSMRHSSYVRNRIINNLRKSDRRLTNQIRALLDGMSEKEKRDFILGSFKAKRLIKLRESIRALAQSFSNETMAEIKTSGRDRAENELEFSEKTLSMIRNEVVRPSITAYQAYTAAMAKPLAGRFVRDFVADLAPSYRKLIDSAIREGFTTGESNANILRRIRGSAGEKYQDGILYKRNGAIDRIVRTSMNHLSNQSRESAYASMGVKKMQWSSVLDGRTSPICASRDGMIFDTGKGPRPPAHPNCRSLMIPHIPGQSGSRGALADDRPLGQIPEEERKGKIQRVHASTNYEKWFGNQDAAFQKKWLGPTKYKLYKQGNYSLGAFVDPTGKSYTIEQLRRLDAELFERLDI